MNPRLPDALLRSQSDERLAALTARGRERAFAVLVERYQAPLLRFARGMTGPHRAEDVVQQGFLQAWTALQQGTEVRNVGGWLHQIVRHASWKATAQKSADRELEDAAGSADTLHATVESRMRLRNIVHHVGELPEHQRIALVQTAFEGRSRSDIASELGVTEGAVRQLVHRGRERLRQVAAGIIPVPLLNWLIRRGDRDSVVQRVGNVARDAAQSPGVLEGATKVAAGVLAVGALAAGAGTQLHHAGHRSATQASSGLAVSDPASAAAAAATRAGFGRDAFAVNRPGSALARALGAAASTAAAGALPGAAGATPGAGAGSGSNPAAAQAQAQTPDGGQPAAGDSSGHSATTADAPSGSAGNGSGSGSGAGSGSGTSSPADPHHPDTSPGPGSGSAPASPADSSPSDSAPADANGDGVPDAVSGLPPDPSPDSTP